MLTTLQPYLLAFCRVAIGLTFAISSLSKALDVPQFVRTIAHVGILPKRMSTIAALLFLSGEFAVVTLMIAGGPLLGPGFALAALLLAIFCVALASILARKLQATCNCFGRSAKPVARSDIWRNAGFILCALGGYGALTVSNNAAASLNLMEWVLVGVSALVVVMIWIQLEEIMQLFQQP